MIFTFGEREFAETVALYFLTWERDKVVRVLRCYNVFVFIFYFLSIVLTWKLWCQQRFRFYIYIDNSVTHIFFFFYDIIWRKTFQISLIFFFFMSFENLNVEFHVPYILNTHIKFRSNRILFIIWSINLFFIFNFRLQKLEIITFIWWHSN